MTKGALFVGWGEIIPSREKAARVALNDAVQYNLRLRQEGKIDGFEAVTTSSEFQATTQRIPYRPHPGLYRIARQSRRKTLLPAVQRSVHGTMPTCAEVTCE